MAAGQYRSALKENLRPNTSLRMSRTGTVTRTRTGSVLFSGIFFVRLVTVLTCFLLVIASHSVQAEPDEPENAVESRQAETPSKAPARQLSPEVIEKLLREELAAEAARADASDEPVQAGPEDVVELVDFDAEEIERAEQVLLSPKAPAPAAEDTPVTAEEVVKDEPETGSEEMATQTPSAVAPGLPRRKPKKPVLQTTNRNRADDRRNPVRGSDRQKHLCRALQACRNDFVRCKSKIKHPDQSPQWSEEKEACGAIYKKCVEKDFQSGEWFFTRWFYFQELNCK